MMMEIVLIILAIILILYICKVKCRKSQCPKQQYTRPLNGSFYTVPYDPNAKYGMVSSQPNSIREVELDNNIRGVAPMVNQPNHTANMWKCDVSQSVDGVVNEIACEGFGAMNSKAVNMNIGDSSRMHITSRFAGAKS
jgi:PBP1b-binding outer membrane lipoprotein LpoB